MNTTTVVGGLRIPLVKKAILIEPAFDMGQEVVYRTMPDRKFIITAYLILDVKDGQGNFICYECTSAEEKLYFRDFELETLTGLE